MASGNESDTTTLALRLADLVAREDLPDAQRWSQVASTAQSLADCLRNRGEGDERSTLGRTPLPRTLSSLMSEILGGPGLPQNGPLSAAYELLRVGANFCMEHDGNRKLLLNANLPQQVVTLLQRFSTKMDMILSLVELKVLKVSAGFLLNASLTFSPIREFLTNMNTPQILLSLRSRVYPPCSWASIGGEASNVDIKEQWEWRRGFADWASLALSELVKNDDDNEEGVKSGILSASSLNPIVDVILPFIPPYPGVSGPLIEDLTLKHALITMDVDMLTDACSLLEGLAIDSVAIQKFIADTVNAEAGAGLLQKLVDFIEFGDYPPYWSECSQSETGPWRKSFDMCKAAVIRAVVEVCGLDKNMDTLWDYDRPGGWYVSRMIKWVKENISGNREDLVICGSLCLGNLARREAHCAILVRPEISLVSDLTYLLRPGTDIKLLHGALGILKHLAQTSTSQFALTEANIIEKLVKSQLWGERVDMAETVQQLGIGTAKHLCTNNPVNAVRLANTCINEEPSSLTGVNQLLALVKRSDTVAVKSEGTRAVFQAIRSICAQSQNELRVEEKRRAIEAMTSSTAAIALAELAHRGRTKPYFILISEGILGLTLLSLQPSGAKLVSQALLTTAPPLPAIGSSRSTSQSSLVSPDSSPSTFLDLLHEIILQDSISSEKTAIELRINACSLLGSAGRQDSGSEGQLLREKSEEILRSIAENTSCDKRLQAAAEKALEAWK